MALLEVQKLYKRFGGNEVLKGIDLSLDKGKVLAIIGSSGSGKTTLLRCLNSLERADSGYITVGDTVIFDGDETEKPSAQTARERQLKFGLVFQQFNLFPQYDVLQNLTLAAQLIAKERTDYKERKKEIFAEIDKEAKELIEQVGLSQKLNSYPFELSGGQQQRVAIARALMLKPEILCFDEPTSALDPELTGEVLSVIRGLASKSMTMIIVTHEMLFARDVADNIAFMSDGVVVEQGAAHDVIDNPQNERTKAFLGKY